MVLTAEARVIAAFTFIVALMLGAWGSLDGLLVSEVSLVNEQDGARFFITLLPIAATAVAYQAAGATNVAWARALGGAAVLLGVLTSLAGVLYFLTYV